VVAVDPKRKKAANRYRWKQQQPLSHDELDLGKVTAAKEVPALVLSTEMVLVSDPKGKKAATRHRRKQQQQSHDELLDLGKVTVAREVPALVL
jgi:hypothetical protein